MDSDKKDAVNIGVTLSTQLIAASLAMIAVVGAFVAFILDKREVRFGFCLVVGGAFLGFVGSIVCGGKGIDTARKEGFIGNWDISKTKKAFGWQANCAFLGIILFICSVFMGKPKAEDMKAAELDLERRATVTEVRDSLLNLTVKKQTVKIEQLQLKLDSLIRANIVRKLSRPRMRSRNE
jgi:hypothetical protein